jgi:hypothetical protein
MVLREFVRSRGAVVWPEIQAALTEGTWIRRHLDPTFPEHFRIEAHHVRSALAVLTPSEIVRESVRLYGHDVVAYLDARALAVRGRQTTVRAIAGAKRRQYRRLLSWTFDNRLCGSIAEQLVYSSLADLTGRRLWLHGTKPGQVSTLLGRPLATGGPLDAAGEWPVDRNFVGAGTIPFAVEIKNLRTILYPTDHDVWDLLAKVGSFPEVLPVLVARRIHFTTFRMFKDLGVLGHESRTQYFAEAIDPARFAATTGALELADAVQVDATRPSARLVRFFGDKAPDLARNSIKRWATAAPIVDRYREFREGLDESSRRELWREFTREVIDAGLYTTGGWGIKPLEPLEFAPDDGELYADDYGIGGAYEDYW